MTELPSTLLGIAIPAAAGLLYALIWYSTRTLPRAAKVLGRGASLLIILPAVLYLSFGMPMQRDRVSQSPPADPRDDGTRAPAPEMRRMEPEPPTSAPPAPAPVPRGGDTAEVQAPSASCPRAAVTGASSFGTTQQNLRKPETRREAAVRLPAFLLPKRPIGTSFRCSTAPTGCARMIPSASPTRPTGRGAWNSAARW